MKEFELKTSEILIVMFLPGLLTVFLSVLLADVPFLAWIIGLLFYNVLGNLIAVFIILLLRGEKLEKISSEDVLTFSLASILYNALPSFIVVTPTVLIAATSKLAGFIVGLFMLFIGPLLAKIVADVIKEVG